MYLLKFENEAELEYAKRVYDPDTEHKAEFPELNDEEGDVETIRVEHHQLENGGYGHDWDLQLQNSQTEGLHVRGSLCNINFEINHKSLQLLQHAHYQFSSWRYGLEKSFGQGNE